MEYSNKLKYVLEKTVEIMILACLIWRNTTNKIEGHEAHNNRMSFNPCKWTTIQPEAHNFLSHAKEKQNKQTQPKESKFFSGTIHNVDSVTRCRIVIVLAITILSEGEQWKKNVPNFRMHFKIIAKQIFCLNVCFSSIFAIETKL